MKISNEVRYELIKYITKDINIKYDDINKSSIEYVLYKNIIIKSSYNVKEQLNEYKRLINNNLNRIVLYCVEQCKIEDKHYNNEREKIIKLYKSYDINSDCNINDIVFSSNKDKELYNLCKYLLDFKQAKRSKYGQYKDNEAAEDWFIFEQTIYKCASELKVGKLFKEISNIQDAGQGYTADVAVNYNSDNYLLIDAKFRSVEIAVEYNHRKPYKYYYYSNDNRNQMSAYITQLAYNKNISVDNIKGILMHAVTNEMLAKAEIINHHTLNVGSNKIWIELINIEENAEQIINNIKEVILKYINNQNLTYEDIQSNYINTLVNQTTSQSLPQSQQ